MPLRAQCPVCGVEIPYATGDTSGQLVRHLHDAHSQVSVVAYRVSTHSTPSTPSTASTPSTTPATPEHGFHEPEKSTGRRPNLQRTTACPFNERRFTGGKARGRGPGKVTCNSCGSANVPLTPQQETKKSPLGALCVLMCWPVCFAGIADVAVVNIFCPRCRHYVGTYDAREGRLQRPPTPGDVATSVKSASLSASSGSSRDDDTEQSIITGQSHMN